MVFPAASKRIRFGRFEADPETQELHRDGVRIPIQGKPFQILMLLLQSQDGVVTRESLFRSLWQDTHVERSRCLNTAMQKLRAALGPEDSQGPRLETLGSLGYRLVAPQASGGHTGSRPERARLVVLRFEDLDAVPEAGFTEGFAEQLASRLGQECPQLVVLGPTAAKARAGMNSDEGGKPHDLVLEGSLRRSATRIHLRFRLRAGESGACLHQESLERASSELFHLQEELVRRATFAVQDHLSARSGNGPGAPTSAPVYQKYLRALHHFANATERDLCQAVELLQDVIAEDDRFAPAHATLGLIYSYTAQFGPLPPSQVYPRIESLAAQAMVLNPELPETQVVLGLTQLLYRSDFQAAETAFRRALKLNPSLPRAYLGFSQVCTVEGRHGEALEALRRAVELQPSAPELGIMLAIAHYFAGDLSAASRRIERTLSDHPGFPLALVTAGWVLSELGRHREAIDALREAETRVPGSPLFRLHLARGLAAAGEASEAKALVEEAVHARSKAWVSPYLIARVYVALKQSASALRWFRQAVVERDGWRVLSGVDPCIAPLVQHPGFRALLAEAGLPCPITPPTPPRKRAGKSPVPRPKGHRTVSIPPVRSGSARQA